MSTTGKKNNKTIINTFIVSLRKDVKHARLWLIRDLKKKATRLVEKKGTEQQKAKNSRKAQRYLDEAATLKQIHPDQVAKYALCKEFAQTDDEEVNKCLKKLVDNKLVQKHIVEFEKTHHIPLDKRVILLRALGTKYNKIKLKKKKALGVEDTSVKKKGSTSPDSDKDSEDSTSPSPKMAKKTNEPIKASPTKSFEKVTAKKTVTKPKPSTVGSDTQSNSAKPKKEAKDKQLSPWKITKNVPKEMEIKQLNLESLDSEELVTTTRDSSPPAEDPALDSPASDDEDAECDPFFLRDGKPPAQVANDIGSRLLSLSKTKEPQIAKPAAAKKPSQPAKFNNQPKKNVKPKEPRQDFKKAQPPAPVIDDKDLHPSWQAKRKEKLVIADIGASKKNHIKFDD